MCTMKKKFQMIGFALSVLLVTLPIVTVGADNAASGKQKKEKTTESALGVKPVTGSWINLAYKDVRNIRILRALIIWTRNCGKLKYVNCRLWVSNIWY